MEPNANAETTEPKKSTETGSEKTDTSANQNATKTEDLVAKPVATDALSSLLKELQTQKTENQDELNQEVVAQLVEEDKKSKVEVLLKGIALFKAEDNVLKGMRPDEERYDQNDVKTVFYSKEMREKRNKQKEKLEKIRKAMNLALCTKNPQYDKLKEELNKAKSSEGKASK